MKANTAVIVKKANTFLVLSTIRTQQLMTIEGIVASTGLSRPTVVTILRDLEKRKIVKKAGFAPAEVGRQPTLYAIDTDAHFAIGIDVDGPPVRIALSNLGGEMLYQASWSHEVDATFDEIADRMASEVNKAIESMGISSDQVLGIGLGLPASVDITSNRAVNLSRLEALRDAPLDKVLTEATGINVVVRNDAHLIALAEKAHTPNLEDYLFIVHRTGIGLAVVLGGKVYEGQTGNAGFIGHTTVDPTGRLCACGATGCLEALASKRAIIDRYREVTGESVPYDEILTHARSGSSSPARDVLVEAAEWFGLGIANLIKILDIYVVVLSDLGTTARHVFARTISDSVRRHVSTFLREPPKIVVGGLRDEEFALGGCHFVIEEFFESPSLRLKA